MKKIILLLSLLLSASAFAHDEMPFLTKVMIDRLEFSDRRAQSWDAQAWLGSDQQKFWLKTEGEREDQQIKNSEFQFLYDKPIADFWDVQLGWRHDGKSENQNWLTVGVQGVAPYWIESNLALFVGENNRVGVRAKGEYEFLLTQHWILISEAEINAGNAISDTRLGLRLHYLIERELMPYVGVQWQKNWKPTADESGALILGVRMWF